MDTAAAEGIASNARIVAGLGSESVQAVAPERFGRFAMGEAGPVRSNHPAFVIGHLSLYPNRISEALGLGLDLAAPEGWELLFAPGVECVDDPEGTIYPEKSVLLDVFTRSHREVIDAVSVVPISTLAKANPVERYRERFPTLMAMANFLLVAHPMLHLGQISAWRRFEGMKSLR